MFADNCKDTNSLALQKKASFILSAGLIAGSIFGTAVWFLLFTDSHSVAVVTIGRFESISPMSGQVAQVDWIEEPQVVAERLRTQSFAKSVAERAAIPEFATLLPAKQYGGEGALSVRSLRDPNLLEVKVSTKDPNTARTAIEAVLDEIVSEHAQILAPLLRDAALRLQSLDNLATEARKSHDRLTKLVEDLTTDSQSTQQSLTLLTLKSLADSNLAVIEKTALEFETILSSQSTRGTRVVQAATIAAAKISSLYRTIALSAVAGLILSFLFLQIRPQSNHLDRPVSGDAGQGPIQP